MKLTQNQEFLLDISLQGKVSPGDLTFGDGSGSSFEGFVQDSIQINEDTNSYNTGLPDLSAKCMTPTDLYIDRPHTRQRGKAVPIPNVMGRPLEFCRNPLEGGGI